MSVKIIRLVTPEDAKKLFAYLRAGAAAVFRIEEEELRDHVIGLLREFARNNRISIRFIEPDGERLLTSVATGAFLGGCIGAAVGGFPGAALGAGIGSAAGCALAHMQVTIRSADGGTRGFLIDIARA